METILSGSYTSDGAARTIYVPSDCDCFEWFVRGNAAGDNWDSAANPGVIKRGWWYRGMDQGTALTVYNTAGAATDASTFVAADGATLINPDDPIAYAATAVTGLTQASPSVITSATHGLVTGDLVRLTNITAALQASSIVYTATRTGANTFTVPLVAAGWAAPGTGGFARRVNKEQFDPKRLTITGITAANPAVITVSTTHLYNVGSKVRLIVPAAFGMVEMNNLIGEVTAIGATTITVDIDSLAFTAFAYPTSAIAAAGVTWPQVVPVGEEFDILTDRTRNTDVRGVYLGATVVGANTALVCWRASRNQGYNVAAD